MFYKLPVLLLVMLCTLPGYGQTYPYKQFTTKDGLINNRCGNVSQDSAGYIWITSDNGICNYDGRKFTFFPGKNSTYYFAHTNTINIYKGQCVFATFGEGFAVGIGNKLTFNALSGNPANQYVYGLFLNDSSRLIAKIYAVELELITGSKKRVLKPPAAIAQKMKSFLMFHKDAEGNIWIGTDAGTYIYAKGNFNAPILIPDLVNKYCNVLKSDFEGNIFIACNHDVYKVFKQHLKDIKNAQPIKFATHKAEITAMGFARNGDIFVSDLPFGVAVYNKSLHFEKELSKHGLPDVVLWDIFVDREENIWFATENGVYRFSNFNFINYIPSNVGGVPTIRNGVVYKGLFLFSTGIDVFRIKDNGITKMYGNQLTINHDVRLLVTPQNTIWLNSNLNRGIDPIRATQVATLDNDVLNIKKTIIFNNDANSVVDVDRAVHINKTNMVFLSLNQKLFLYKDEKIEKIILPPILDTLNFNAICKGVNDNEIILAVNKTGFFHCVIQSNNNAASLTIVDQKMFEDDLKNDKCTKIILSKSKNIWLATKNNGIRIFNKQNNKYVLNKTVTEPAISSSLITEIMEDNGGNLWIGSNKGVDKITVGPQNNFSINKGLYNNLMNGSLVYFLKEHQGKLYIGTTGSLSTVDINAKLSSIIPFVHISHLTVNNDNVDSLLSAGSHTFFPNQNNLTFEFVSPTFINEQLTQYQYQLDGIDKEWSTPNSNYIITYNQLPAGNYTFRVRAKNANGVWSLNDATFSFTIKKPFYKHWLFFVLCAGIVIAVCYWLYKQKVNRLIAVERTRRSISKDLHDDIGTTLSSITLMNAVLKNKIESQPDEAKKMAAKIENTSRDMIQNMSDIVWSINPNNDTMEKLIYRLQQFSSDIFDKPEIRHQFNIDEEIKSKVLNMQLRRDIFLICKEIINNAAKYSNATNFSLSLSLKQKNILITATDNGVGFDENLADKGNGLTNIRQRVNTYNGEVELTSENGTTWHITIPT